MIKEPETYEELIRYKRCVDLTSYYSISADLFEYTYNYLETYPKALIVGNTNSLTYRVTDHPEIQPTVVNVNCTDSSIDGIKMSNTMFTIIPHYTPSSGGGYYGGSSGGTSSNNNNNNNNNNNR
jgi:hypothetical protein